MSVEVVNKYRNVAKNDIAYIPAFHPDFVYESYGLKRKDTKTDDDSEKSYEAKSVDVSCFAFLSFKPQWMLLVTMSVIGLFIQTSYRVIFDFTIITQNTYMLLVYLGFGTINLMDTLSSVIHFFSKQLSYQMVYKRKHITLVIADIVSISSMAVGIKLLIAYDRFCSNLELVMVVWRMHRPAQYFYMVTASPIRQGLTHVLIKYSILIYVVVHTFACFLQMVACFDCKTFEDHWTDGMANDTKPSVLFAETSFRAISWIASIGLVGPSRRNDVEFVICIVLMLFNLFIMNGVFLGAFTSVQIEEYRRRTTFGNRLTLIMQQLNHKNITMGLSSKIKIWYYNFWQKESAVHDLHMYDILPPSIKSDIELDKYWYALNQSLILRNVSYGLKRALASCMMTEYYSKGDRIVQQGLATNTMFFVAAGTVQVVAPDDIESPIITLGYGSCIGDSYLLLNIPSAARIIASSYCKLHLLDKTTMWRLVAAYTKLEESQKIYQTRKGLMGRCYQHHREKYLDLRGSKKRVDKTLKLIKKVLETTFTGTEKIKKTFAVTDLYIINKQEGISKHKDLIFATTDWPWILYPNTQLQWIWNTLVFIYSVIVVIVYPYVLFYLQKSPLLYTEFLRPFAYILFIADIIMQISTAVEDDQKKLDTTYGGIISKRFTEMSFLVDLLSIAPCEVFSQGIWGVENIGMHNKFLQCNHMLKIIRILDYFTGLTKRLNVTNDIRIVYYIIYLVYLGYLQGLFYFTAGCPQRPCQKPSWVIDYQTELKPDIRIDDEYDLDILFVSFMFGLLLLTGTGGRIFVTNLAEKILITIYFVSFIFLYTYLLADYSATLTLSQSNKQNYIDEVATMRSFMIENKLDKVLLNRLNDYLETQWDLTQGVGVKELMDDIPAQFFEKLNKDKYSYMLEFVPFFKLFSKSKIRKICGKSVLELLPPNEYVTYSGDSIKEMYIIERGFCEIIAMDGHRTQKIMGPMSSICVIDMLLDVPVLYSVRTLTSVSILKITRETIEASLTHEKRQHLNSIIDSTKNTIAVRRLFLRTSDAEHMPYIGKEEFGSFFNFPSGKLHPLNVDYQRGWSKLHLLKYFIRRRTILPTGKFIYNYEIFHAVVVVLMCCFTPSIFVYQCVIDKAYIAIFSNIVDMLLLLDCYLRLHVCYYNEDGILVTHPRCTAAQYLMTSFAVDFVTSLPLKQILELIMESNVACCLSLIKILRCYRVIDAFAYSRRDVLKYELIWTSIFKYLLLTIVFFNTLASLLLLIGCDYVRKPGLDVLLPKNNSWVYTIKHTVFSINEESEAQPLPMYYLSIYFIIQISQKMSLGDITVVGNQEIIFCMVVVISGYVWFTYILVTISNIKASLNISLTKYQNHMMDLVAFMKNHKIPKSIQNKNIRQFEYIWKRTKGKNTVDVLENFHMTLKGDVITSLYMDTLKLMPIFEAVDPTFFRILGMHVEETYFLQFNDITCINDIVDNIYIIHRGIVRVIGPDGNVMATLTRGAIFGNLDNIGFIRSTITTQTSNTVDILYLKTDKFYEILQKYPVVRRKLKHHLTMVNLAYITSISFVTQEELDEIARDMKIIQQRRKLTRSERFSMSRAMEVISLIIAYISYFIVIYHASFLNHTYLILFLTYLTDFGIIVKTNIAFKTPYINRLGEIITDKKLIKSRYLRQSQFYYDMLSLIPLEILAFAIPGDDIWLYVAMLRLNRTVRAVNMRQFFDLTYDYLNVNVLAIKLFSMFVFCSTYIHTLTCLFYVSACPNAKCIKRSWYYFEDEEEPVVTSPYIGTLYYTTSILTSAGYSTMYPKSAIGITAFIVAVTVTQFVMTIFISNIAAVVRHYGNALVEYSQKTSILKTYMANAQISLLLRERVLCYVEQLWILWKGRHMPIYMNNNVGPPPLVEELKILSFGGHVFDNILFEGCHDDFRRLLVNQLQMTVYFRDDFITKQGDIDDTMYFIHTGTVDVLYNAGNEEILVDILQTNDCFGMIQGIFKNTPHSHSYQAKTVTEVVTLKFNDWKHLLVFYPASKYVIYSTIRLPGFDSTAYV